MIATFSSGRFFNRTYFNFQDSAVKRLRWWWTCSGWFTPNALYTKVDGQSVW